MFKMNRLMFALALTLSPAALGSTAEASGLAHTWVTAGGNDMATCDISAPCATFAGAIGKTSAGGEISCVNSGDFGGGTLTITASVTIDCEGTLGSPTIAGGATVEFLTVQTSPGAVVVLRGVDFDALSQGSCTTGGAIIRFNGAGVLHIQKSKINHAGGGCSGIAFEPSGGSAELDISDCDITDNATSGSGAGIYINPSSGLTGQVSIDRSHINNNYFGIFADGRSGGIIKVTIGDSVVSGNTEDGIAAISSGSSVVFMIDQTKVTGNSAAGLFADGSNAGMLARNSTVYGNAIGLYTGGGGALYSYGNNSVAGNSTNGAFTGTAGLQ
jgi:hypothetical protein